MGRRSAPGEKEKGIRVKKVKSRGVWALSRTKRVITPLVEAALRLPRAVISSLKTDLSDAEVSLFISRGCNVVNHSHLRRIGSTLASSARRRRSSIKPGATPQVSSPTQSMRATGAAVAVGVTSASMTIAGEIVVCVIVIMDIMSAITPAATFAPVARQ